MTAYDPQIFTEIVRYKKLMKFAKKNRPQNIDIWPNDRYFGRVAKKSLKSQAFFEILAPFSAIIIYKSLFNHPPITRIVVDKKRSWKTKKNNANSTFRKLP